MLKCVEDSLNHRKAEAKVNFMQALWHSLLRMWTLHLNFRLNPGQVVCACVHVQSLQSQLVLCDPVDCSPPVSSVHEILQARILEWAALPSSRGSS